MQAGLGFKFEQKLLLRYWRSRASRNRSRSGLSRRVGGTGAAAARSEAEGSGTKSEDKNLFHKIKKY